MQHLAHGEDARGSFKDAVEVLLNVLGRVDSQAIDRVLGHDFRDPVSPNSAHVGVLRAKIRQRHRIAALPAGLNLGAVFVAVVDEAEGVEERS